MKEKISTYLWIAMSLVVLTYLVAIVEYHYGALQGVILFVMLVISFVLWYDLGVNEVKEK